MITVKEILEAMKLPQYVHILIRRKLPLKTYPEYLGGGYYEQIIQRYGSEKVNYITVHQFKLIIYIY